MPLFRRREEETTPPDPDRPSAPARVLPEPEILGRLEEEIFRAGRYGRPLVVICLVPQHLPDHAVGPEEVAGAAAALSGRLRFCDIVGALRDGTLVAVLPETADESARVVAQRAAADLVVRSAGHRRRNWRGGVARVPEDGTDPPAVVEAALRRAAP